MAHSSDQGGRCSKRNRGTNRLIRIPIQQNGRRVDIGNIHGVHQHGFVLLLGQNGTPYRIFPLPVPLSFSLPYHTCLCSHNGRARTSSGLLKGGQQVSIVPGHRKDNFQGVTASADFPDASPTPVESFEEPDERVDECDPQDDLHPCIGDEFRERVCRSDDDKVV